MVPLLLALFAVGQPGPPSDAHALGHSGVIVSTIGHSEWCPPGDMRLDLETGRYLVIRRAPRKTCNESNPEREVASGILALGQLQRVRAAALLVQTDGALNSDCRAGGKPLDHVVISNGGTPHLLLSTDRAFTWAPDDLSCWSEAVHDLYNALGDTFGTREWR